MSDTCLYAMRRRCSLHRLADGGGGLMSDTCDAARKTKRILIELVRKQADEVCTSSHLGGQKA